MAERFDTNNKNIEEGIYGVKAESSKDSNEVEDKIKEAREELQRLKKDLGPAIWRELMEDAWLEIEEDEGGHA